MDSIKTKINTYIQNYESDLKLVNKTIQKTNDPLALFALDMQQNLLKRIISDLKKVRRF
jgi:hypothetical protein